MEPSVEPLPAPRPRRWPWVLAVCALVLALVAGGTVTWLVTDQLGAGDDDARSIARLGDAQPRDRCGGPAPRCSDVPARGAQRGDPRPRQGSLPRADRPDCAAGSWPARQRSSTGCRRCPSPSGSTTSRARARRCATTRPSGCPRVPSSRACSCATPSRGPTPRSSASSSSRWCRAAATGSSRPTSTPAMGLRAPSSAVTSGSSDRSPSSEGGPRLVIGEAKASALSPVRPRRRPVGA